jgi:hypothetical protein
MDNFLPAFMLYYGVNVLKPMPDNKGVIPLAEFCECGSLIIGGRCSNKSCSLRGGDKPAAGGKPPRQKGTPKSPGPAKQAVVKPANPRRASRVVTYNLYETKEKEPEG